MEKKETKITALFLLIFGILIIAYFVARFMIKYHEGPKKRYDFISYNERPFLLVNVLEKKFFEDAHIEESISVPFEEIPEFLSYIDKDKLLIFYCSNYWCTASHEAADMATKQGFIHAKVYAGGMAEWYQIAKKDKGYRYEGVGKEPYLSIVIIPPEETEKKYQVILANELQKFLKERIIKR